VVADPNKALKALSSKDLRGYSFNRARSTGRALAWDRRRLACIGPTALPCEHSRRDACRPGL